MSRWPVVGLCCNRRETQRQREQQQYTFHPHLLRLGEYVFAGGVPHDFVGIVLRLAADGGTGDSILGQFSYAAQQVSAFLLTRCLQYSFARRASQMRGSVEVCQTQVDGQHALARAGQRCAECPVSAVSFGLIDNFKISYYR
jgi:hypothetical protein